MRKVLFKFEFDMKYESVKAKIVDYNSINNNSNKKLHIKNQFIYNDWYVPIFEFKKSLLEKNNYKKC